MLNFFSSQIRRVDTETPPQLVEEEHLMMDFGTTVGKSVNFHPVSYCVKKLPECFPNSIRHRHFPVIFHIACIASLNLFLFLFSMTLTLIAGSLQQKIHGDHGGDRNIVGFAEIISEINGQNPRQLLLPLLHGPQVPGNGHSMAGVLRV